MISPRTVLVLECVSLLASTLGLGMFERLENARVDILPCDTWHCLLWCCLIITDMSRIVDSIYTTAVTLVACDKMNGLEITEGWMWGSSWDESRAAARGPN